MQSDAERQEPRRAIKDAASRQNAAEVVRLTRELLAASGKAADVMFCASSFAGIGEAL